jgi:hypothetical protein
VNQKIETKPFTLELKKETYYETSDFLSPKYKELYEKNRESTVSILKNKLFTLVMGVKFGA